MIRIYKFYYLINFKYYLVYSNSVVKKDSGEEYDFLREDEKIHIYRNRLIIPESEIVLYTKEKLLFYKEKKTNITFRLKKRLEYFIKGTIKEIEESSNYIILELDSQEEAIIFIEEIDFTSIYPSSINPIQYFERKNIPDWKRYLVFQRNNDQCELKLKGCTNTATEIDHWIPIIRGGSDDISNLKACCSNCNKIKSDKLFEEIPAELKD